MIPRIAIATVTAIATCLALFGLANFSLAQTSHAQSEATFKPPSEATIPDGPAGVAIREGKKLVTETRQRLPGNVGNGLNCTNCHLAGGTTANAAPWVGIWGVFPEYRARNGRLISLQERVNDCFERSMNGSPLAYNSDEMNNILAYMQWLSAGIPTGKSVKGRGFVKLNEKLKANSADGELLYAEKCANCHGAQGQGMKNSGEGYLFPPVWGMESFNDGAGMARTWTAAAFIKYNMPLGQGGTLTEQQSLDLAEFMTNQPRPVFAHKVGDWPKGARPRDAR